MFFSSVYGPIQSGFLLLNGFPEVVRVLKAHSLGLSSGEDGRRFLDEIIHEAYENLDANGRWIRSFQTAPLVTVQDPSVDRPHDPHYVMVVTAERLSSLGAGLYALSLNYPGAAASRLEEGVARYLNCPRGLKLVELGAKVRPVGDSALSAEWKELFDGFRGELGLRPRLSPLELAKQMLEKGSSTIRWAPDPGFEVLAVQKGQALSFFVVGPNGNPITDKKLKERATWAANRLHRVLARRLVFLN